MFGRNTEQASFFHVAVSDLEAWVRFQGRNFFFPSGPEIPEEIGLNSPGTEGIQDLMAGGLRRFGRDASDFKLG